MLKLRRMLPGAILVLMALGIASPGMAATFSQGYGVGCELGLTEAYQHEHFRMFLVTLALAKKTGAESYTQGLRDGYWECTGDALDPVRPDHDCDRKDCDATPSGGTRHPLVVTGLPGVGPGQWVSSTLGGAPDTCLNGLVCAEFQTLDGMPTALGSCCIDPQYLGSEDPYHCVSSYEPATEERNDREE